MREPLTLPTIPVAELRDVTKIYRRRHLGRLTLTPGVQNISFSIQSGEIFGLLGLNGAGKTTTIKLLLGLLFTTKGEVRLFDTPLPNSPIMSQVGYLPELPTLYKHLTIEELLRLYGNLSGLSKEGLETRLPQVIQLVGLDSHQKKHLKEFSKGMMQRAGLAQALLHNPQLLVLDEPVSGLDPLGLKELRHLIETLNQLGKTIFFSSHIISEAEKLCHRVGIMHQGRLVRIIPRSEWQNVGLEPLFLETIHA